jgi:hypothetical protein
MGKDGRADGGGGGGGLEAPLPKRSWEVCVWRGAPSRSRAPRPTFGPKGFGGTSAPTRHTCRPYRRVFPPGG